MLNSNDLRNLIRESNCHRCCYCLTTELITTELNSGSRMVFDHIYPQARVDRMFASSLKETRIYRELEQEIILRQMKKLTGSDLSQAVVDRIEALPVEQLDRLAEDLLSFRTVEDMVTWLDGRSS
jgi:Domain of unknown function (DUF4351)/Pou domain - N-terminal to homeobox domain